MIVMIPAVPAFAGDLKLDEALGTRAIMECKSHEFFLHVFC